MIAWYENPHAYFSEQYAGVTQQKLVISYAYSILLQ